jgi:ParB family chromosome partitioning protein
MDEIIYIPVEKLHPHPDNPRKNLGDLTELTESIKVSGILQNLTVVPWFSTWKPCDDPKQQEEMGYRVIIGHRRLAAAKVAGLTELPCIIREMYHDEQIKTMLIENMQRNDLTVYEQAQGFQMMMNLGDSIEEIAQKSGFSQTTVRRRVKLLKLDQEKFKESIERGATLTDYMELDKISSTERKNEVLDAIGTKNFRQKLQQAIDTEKREAFVEKAKAFAAEFAKEITEVDRNVFQYVRNYGYWNKGTLEQPGDADSVQYFYRIGREQIDLYRKITAGKSEEEQRKQARKEEYEYRLNGLKEATNRAYHLRYNFIKDYTRAKSNSGLITQWLALAAMYQDIPNHKLLAGLLHCECDDNTDKISEVDYIAEYESRPDFARLCTVYATFENVHDSYYADGWSAKEQCYKLIYDNSEKLDKLYRFLELLGYEMSNEEISLMSGTHELFEEVPSVERARRSNT